ncbi:hypothetical protein ScPMuIL_013071 [Solemya velum]
MPVCYVKTNLKESEVPEGFEGRLAEAISSILKKEIKYIFAVVEYGLRMSNAESTSPTCVVQIHSKAAFDAEKNPEYTRQFNEFIKKELGVPGDRIVFLYCPVEDHNGAIGN